MTVAPATSLPYYIQHYGEAVTLLDVHTAHLGFDFRHHTDGAENLVAARVEEGLFRIDQSPPLELRDERMVYGQRLELAVAPGDGGSESASLVVVCLERDEQRGVGLTDTNLTQASLVRSVSLCSETCANSEVPLWYAT